MNKNEKTVLTVLVMDGKYDETTLSFLPNSPKIFLNKIETDNKEIIDMLKAKKFKEVDVSPRMIEGLKLKLTIKK